MYSYASENFNHESMILSKKLKQEGHGLLMLTISHVISFD